MNARCRTCGQPSATIQVDLFDGPSVCLDCQTKAWIEMMLKVLPIEDDDEWADLSKFEQSFLSSVSDQFARKGTLSEKQLRVLERIYKKHN